MELVESVPKLPLSTSNCKWVMDGFESDSMIAIEIFMLVYYCIMIHWVITYIVSLGVLMFYITINKHGNWNSVTSNGFRRYSIVPNIMPFAGVAAELIQNCLLEIVSHMGFSTSAPLQVEYCLWDTEWSKGDNPNRNKPKINSLVYMWGLWDWSRLHGTYWPCYSWNNHGWIFLQFSHVHQRPLCPLLRLCGCGFAHAQWHWKCLWLN